jgi:hypothetical protein
MRILSPLLQKPGSELEGTQLRLAKCDRCHFLACNGFKDGFEGGTESTHPDAREAVGSRPDDV